jgi:hypothetical protein
MSAWQTIETAPMDGTIIILRGLWNASGTLPMLAVAGCYNQHLGWWMRDNQGCGFTVSCSPTHWMPLPGLGVYDPHKDEQILTGDRYKLMQADAKADSRDE